MIAAVESDDRILVIAGGPEGISCWGDILANAAKVKGVRGSVIDGMSRDIEGSESIGYPVFGRGIAMISARNRIVQVQTMRARPPPGLPAVGAPTRADRCRRGNRDAHR